MIDHIGGQFSYRALDDGRTEVTWSDSVAQKTFVARPFMHGFLDNGFAPFMQGGRNGAAAYFNADS